MHFYGNPATQIWQKIMEDIHTDLKYKDFKVSYGGAATGIFGSREELEDQKLTEKERQKKAEEEAKKAEEEAKKNEEAGKNDQSPESPTFTTSPEAA